MSETLYPDETFGYVDVSKITSVEGRTYTVAEGQADSKALDQIGVDPSWEKYFAQKAK
jgi:hypothetical protein